MNALVHYLIIASTACVVNTTDHMDDVYMFLPFLESQSPPPSCPPNEFYKTCSGNCSDCVQRAKCVITKCVEGCDCAPRFFRLTPEGPCEPVANCPKRECGENEVFRECGPVCERCTTYKCQIISCDHTCYCTKGYLRNTEGICIPEEECPKRTRCGRSEEWSDTGLINEYCLYSEDAHFRNETQDVPQCYCKEGHKRNNLGYCVNETRCHSAECYGIEVHNNCVPKCNTTCRNYGDPDCFEDDNCYEGCFCPSGYVMNDFRTCIPIEECTPDTMHILVREEPETTEEAGSSDKDSLTTQKPIENMDTKNTTETIVNDETNCTDSNSSQTESSSESQDGTDDLNYKTESSAEPGEDGSNDKSESSDEPTSDYSNDKSESSGEFSVDGSNGKKESSGEPCSDDSNDKSESSDEYVTNYSNDKSESLDESVADDSNDKNASSAEACADDSNDKSKSSDESGVDDSSDKSVSSDESIADDSNDKSKSPDEPGADGTSDKSVSSDEISEDDSNKSKSSDESGGDGSNNKSVSSDEDSADVSNSKKESPDEKAVADTVYASDQSSSQDEYDFDNDAI